MPRAGSGFSPLAGSDQGREDNSEQTQTVRLVSPMSAQYKHETIIAWSNEDQAYLAEAPELPGCMANGKTCESAALIVIPATDRCRSPFRATGS